MSLDNGWVGTPSLTWKKPIARFVGVAKQWRDVLYRWVGHNGRWVLQWVDGAAPAATPRIEQLSAYSAEPYVGGIIATSAGAVDPRGVGNLYAYYLLSGTFGDYLENFSSATADGAPVFINDLGRSVLILNGTTQRVRAPTGGVDAYNMDGLMGTLGDSDWTVAIQFKLVALPPPGEIHCIFSAGVIGRFVAICVGSTGQLWVIRQSGGSESAQFVPAPFVAAGMWTGVCVTHDHGAVNSTDKVYLNGTLVLTATYATVVVLGDGAGVDVLWIGYGPKITGTGPVTTSGYKYVAGRFSFWRIENAVDTVDAATISRVYGAKLYLTNEAGVKTEHTEWLVRSWNNEFMFNMPPVAEGNYLVSFYDGLFETNALPIRCVPLEVQNTTYIEDWSVPIYARRRWMAAHKQWGGDNGGVSAQNVALQDGTLVLESHGDTYAGTVTGTDRFGEDVVRVTRVGAAAVTRRFFGPGSFEVEMQLPAQTGAVVSLWTFHYEEVYPNDPRYAAFQAEGLGISGSFDQGYYIVRNNEIDIELPTNLDPASSDASWLNARCNAWRGERTGEYTPEEIVHGLPLPDGEFHRYRFDWHLDDETPRVEFYFDGVLVQTITTTIPDIPMRVWIGVWFPSGVVPWAGATAPWSRQQVVCRKFTYHPFSQVGLRPISETYPNDFFRSIDLANTLTPIG